MPVTLEKWLDLLQTALEQEPNLPTVLQTLSLTPATIAKLFEITAAHLPTSENILLMSLLQTQNRVMAAMDTMVPSSPQFQQTQSEEGLTAITHLSEKLLRCTQVDQLLQKAATTIAETLGYTSVNLFLVKNRSKTLALPASLWQNKVPSPDEITAFVEQIASTSNIISRVVETGQAQIADPLSDSDRSIMPHPGAEIAVPLIRREQTIGVLHIFNLAPGDLTAGSLFTLQAIASQLVLAMENVQLRASIQQHKYEQRILLQSNATLGSDLDQDEALTVMAQQMTKAVRAGGCVICRWDPEQQTITALVEYIQPDNKNPNHTWREVNKSLTIREDPLGNQVLQTMRPLALQAKDAASFSPKSNHWSQPGWHSLLMLPLQVQGKPYGLIEIYDRDSTHHFTAEDIQLGTALANQAAIVIERTALFYEIQNRLNEVSTFYTLSQQIVSNLDLDELLNHLVTTLRQIADCRACVIFLLDEDQALLEIKAAAGLKALWAKTARLKVGQGAAGKAVAQKRTIYIPDTQQDPDYIFFDRAVRSLIVVPLIHGDNVIGTINLDHSEPDAFGKVQERLLTVAAAQAAIAIEHATLFNQIRSEEQNTRAIIQHMADGLLLIGPTGTIKRVNPTLAMMLGLDPNEIIGQNAHAQDLDPRLAAVCAPTTIKARTGVLTNEVTIPGPKPRVLQIFATTITDKQDQPMGEVRVVHDITKERELEKMKDDLMSTVTHELRTPLFSIRGFVHILLDDDPPDAETQREFLKIIEREASQLADLVTHLLDSNKLSTDLVKIEEKSIQPIEIINQAILKLQGFAHNEKVNLISQIPPALPRILGDPQRLERVLTNLVGNAIKFTPPGGSVTITAQADQAYLTIIVADTGIGIPEADLPHIFSKFYQVEGHYEQAGPGSGLGLHISKQIIEAHNGKIWAESKPNQGSTFFVQFPLLNNDLPQ